jgi:xanthine dehydrogenase YagS FAD-binding subunit
VEPFEYRRAATVQASLEAARTTRPEVRGAHNAAAQFIAGGTNLTDYMTLGVAKPHVLVDINDLQDRFGRIETDPRRLRLGALVRMSEAEDHLVIQRDYPVIAQTLLLSASRQIRNMASLGGNVLQRTRCEYFREVSWPCNKRRPGSGCGALEGINRQHAVLGATEHCIATYPGDFAQALIALEATIETVGGPSGPRTIPFAELHRLPDDTPHLETSLAPGELITFLNVPAGPWTRRSCYVKVRDRDSYQFALTSAAVALHLEGDLVQEARIALGGVATIPWRAREAEAVLGGHKLNEGLAAKAAAAAFAGARPRHHNAFKIPIGQQTLVRALLQAQQMEVPTS